MGETFSKLRGIFRKSNKVKPAPSTQDEIISGGDNQYNVTNVIPKQQDEVDDTMGVIGEPEQEDGNCDGNIVTSFHPENTKDTNDNENDGDEGDEQERSVEVTKESEILDLVETNQTIIPPLPEDKLSNGDNKGIQTLNTPHNNDDLAEIGDNTIEFLKCEGQVDNTAFFCPLNADRPPTPVRIPKRLLSRPRTPVMSYEERMLLADLNRFHQLDKKREFAVKQNQTLPRNRLLPKIRGLPESAPEQSTDNQTNKTDN